MRYLSIKNFDQYQHYKDWQPPWIKLYNRLLDDYAFLQLPEVSQRHLICLWLLASRHDNRIPNDLAYISRAIHAKSEVNLGELIAAGFVEPTDAGPARKRRKVKKIRNKRKSRTTLEQIPENSTPETETEGETDKRQKGHSSATRKRGKGGSGVAKPPTEKPPSWVAEGVAWWTGNVGATTHPRFGKALTAAVGVHGWPDVFTALQCYVTECKAKDRPPKPEWLAAEIVLWIEKAKAPPTQDDVLTPAAKRALGIVA